MSVACHLAFFEAESGHCVLDRFFWRTNCPWLQAPAGPGADTMSGGVGASAVVVSANSLHDTAACGHVLNPASAASHAGGSGGRGPHAVRCGIKIMLMLASWLNSRTHDTLDG